ncbi:hypothetical protein SEA_COLUCCI_84 [Arthrobacter phage Colucci]|uniref:Uncharacterized protein n=1 Tax=Arthrobacter phage Colucci TaxID=2015834 RepID=A0A286N2Z6_9CAUD|nr:hypothetical protein FDI27_gp084 [Arthrobacter phage Colucci]ASX98753.1 hypothetical protein SEA_COLUCCI_84 [Arthrobacter phage Colucci]
MKAKREPRTFDFRETYWGHNFGVSGVPTKRNPGKWKRGKFTGWTISTPRPQPGDLMIWATKLGHIVAKITHVDPYRDPDDMAKIKGKIVERVRKE